MTTNKNKKTLLSFWYSVGCNNPLYTHFLTDYPIPRRVLGSDFFFRYSERKVILS